MSFELAEGKKEELKKRIEKKLKRTVHTLRQSLSRLLWAFGKFHGFKTKNLFCLYCRKKIFFMEV